MSSSSAGENTLSEPVLDFRADDDAWYTIGLALQNETLIVKYVDFSDDFDDEFDAGNFENLEELVAFEEKFRLASIQLQDYECGKVIPGMKVTAAYVYSESDLKFYNAVIDSIERKHHTFEDGEEVCNCLFKVSWQHGPMIGSKESVRIERICRVRSGSARIDPALATFLKMSKEKLELSSRNSGFILEDDCCGLEGESVTKWQKNEQDLDLGGGATVTAENQKEKDNCHFILVDNLEKDLSPPTIVNFVDKHVSIKSQAFVFPSLSSETYTRGIIVADSKEKLQKIADFVRDPAHLIMSSSGRPWVMTEEKVRVGTFGNFMSRSKSQRRTPKQVELGSKVKVVRSGTIEFKKGKRLRDLFMDFAAHQQHLHKRLSLEEDKILRSPNTA